MVEHRRTLDFKIAFVIGLGTMIAAGIFSLSGTAVAAIGRSAVVAFVLAAVVAGLTAASYPRSGSPRCRPASDGTLTEPPRTAIGCVDGCHDRRLPGAVWGSSSD